MLDARASHPESSLADLYDPVAMPPDLRKAHQALDKAVDVADGRGTLQRALTPECRARGLSF
ncbi:MAG: type IIL restriction-modification enzyme MmeI [Thermodesulfovibrionales bacterium]